MLDGDDDDDDDDDEEDDEEAEEEDDDGEPAREGAAVSPVAEVSTITKVPSTATMVPNAGGMLRI